MNLRRVSDVVEAVVATAVVAFVVLLFTNSATPPPASPPAAVAAAGVDGSALYGRSCAGCHGGDGSGGIGPKLGGGRVVAQFPDPALQAAVISEGRRGMPAFGERLTAEEIEAIVEFTRTVLAGTTP